MSSVTKLSNVTRINNAGVVSEERETEDSTVSPQDGSFCRLGC